LAFEPRNRLEEKHLYRKRSDPRDRVVGLSQRFPRDRVVKGSYDKVTELTRHVIANLDKKRHVPIPTATIAGVKDWLDKNQPKESRIHPTLPLLRTAKAAVLAKPSGKADNTRDTSVAP
ncbi:MAG: hypothetical protein ACE5KM_20775, partial [Planctomycetaceae bacterium]